MAEFLCGVDMYLAVFRDSDIDYTGQMVNNLHCLLHIVVFFYLC